MPIRAMGNMPKPPAALAGSRTSAAIGRATEVEPEPVVEPELEPARGPPDTVAASNDLRRLETVSGFTNGKPGASSSARANALRAAAILPSFNSNSA